MSRTCCRARELLSIAGSGGIGRRGGRDNGATGADGAGANGAGAGAGAADGEEEGGQERGAEPRVDCWEGGGGEGAILARLWEGREAVAGERGVWAARPRKEKEVVGGTQRCASNRIRKEKKKKKTKRTKKGKSYIVKNRDTNGRIATVARLVMEIPRERELPARRKMILAERPAQRNWSC